MWQAVGPNRIRQAWSQLGCGRLDRRRVIIFLQRKRLQDGLRKPEVLECHGLDNSHYAAPAHAENPFTGKLRSSFDVHLEKPGTYRLLVEWETLEDHTVAFRNSEAFQKWRSLVGSCFAATPRVDHSETVVEAH